MSQMEDELRRLQEIIDASKNNEEKGILRGILKGLAIFLAVIACLAGIFWGIVKPLFGIGKDTRSSKPDYSTGSEEENNELTEDKYNSYVKDFSSTMKSAGFSKSEITNFCAVVNASTLKEQNAALGGELFSEVAEAYTDETEQFNKKSADSYFELAARVLSRVTEHNLNSWKDNNNTDDFIWFSSVLVNKTDREKMELLEDYVRNIAEAVNEKDAEKVNSIVASLVKEMTGGRLDTTKMSAGCRFAMSSYLESIADAIAKDYLNSINAGALKSRKGVPATVVRKVVDAIKGCIATIETDSKEESDSLSDTQEKTKNVSMAAPVAGNIGGKGYNPHARIQDTTNHGYSKPYTRKLVPPRTLPRR